MNPNVTDKENAALDNEVLRAISQRRSLRKYKDEPVPRELLEELAVMARWAPSNWNSQPWRLYFFDTKEEIATLCDGMDSRADAALANAEDHHLHHFVSHCMSYFYAVRDSPVVVAMFYKPFSPRLEELLAESFGDETRGGGWNPNLISFGMAAQNMLLAAHSMGLAGCFHSGPVAFVDGHIHEMLGLHPKLILGGLITLGWPDESEEPGSKAKRKKLDLFLNYADERIKGKK